MLLLGIESSCDDTAAAIVEDGRAVRSSVVASQADEHARFGGVVPEIASRSHLVAANRVVEQALDEAGLGWADLDGIAVTARPGLLGSLLVGVSIAKGLAWRTGLPLVDVHHIEAHAYSAVMELDEAPYPCLVLVVSGGHTALYRADNPRTLQRLGSTRDDAAGEAFDKVSSLLGTGYPGGPQISKLAVEGDPAAIAFPRYRNKPDRALFSFSGLKTAVLYHLRGGNPKAPTPAVADIPNRADVAASFQAAAVDSLVEPTLRVAREQGLDRILAAGGVACNQLLRERLTERAAAEGRQVDFPSPAFCTDNAVMIAGLGYHHLREGRRAGLDLDACPR